MKRFFYSTAIVLGLATASSEGTAQIINPGRKVKDKGEQRANNRIDQTIDKGFDKIDEGLDNVFNGKKKKKAEENSEDYDYEENNGTTTQSNSNHTTQQSGTNTDFSQYKGSSFIPGKDVLFFEDFATVRLGTGSGNWHVKNHDLENPASITTIGAGAGNWLKIPRYGIFFPNSFKSLPEDCTIEFDMYINSETVSEMQSGLRFSFVANEDRENFDLHFNENPEVTIDIHPYGNDGFVNFWGGRQYGLSEEQAKIFNNTEKNVWKTGQVNHVAITRKSIGIKVFVNGREYINEPTAFLSKGKYNFMMSSNQWGDGIYISNIRVGSHTTNATEEIKSAGKFVTNTIYFDVNSSHIKPESWATLNNAAQAIKATTGTILIIGHTDSDGTDDANLKLSQNRANAVKNALVKEFSIAASRLSTDGKGESQPVSDNNTASGKAQNRRVEFVKQ